jgi:alkylation response protein AidB-like acyl-CoA dehydrogenase
MGLQTTAKLSEDGKEWIINGSKKWITNATFADYFTVGCRTDVSLNNQSLLLRTTKFG